MDENANAVGDPDVAAETTGESFCYSASSAPVVSFPQLPVILPLAKCRFLRCSGKS